MNNLFTSPGSKTRLAKRLIGMFPAHHTYIEPFAGGAACFWQKSPSPLEILNDYDSDIATTYQVIRDLTTGQINQLLRSNWVVSQDQFDICQETSSHPLTNTYRFIYRRKASFGAREKQIQRTRIGATLPTPKHLHAQVRRLRGVQVSNTDGLDVIKAHDKDGVFMFIDPPWPDYFWKWTHYQMDHIRALVETLAQVQKAKWLYAETPTIKTEIAELPGSWNELTLRTPSMSYHGKKVMREEVVFSNYAVRGNDAD